MTLLGGLIFVLMNQRKEETTAAPVLSEARPPLRAIATPAAPASSDMETAPFHWSQLVSAKDYRAYIANLRAIGCPEPTIEDIVRGDTDRAFAWERSQLDLDGAGTGPWSQAREMQLVASLLSGQPPVETAALAQSAENPMDGNSGNNEASQTATPPQVAANQTPENTGGMVAQVPVPSQNAERTAPSYPLFLQNVNWSALGFNADQQAAIAQVRQQFLGEINGLSQNPNDPASQNSNPSVPDSNNPAPLTQWQTALQNADAQLLASLGSDGYEAYVQQQYHSWYQPQVVAANAEGKPLVINPDAFSVSP